MDREFRCCAGRIGRRAALELGICLALAPCLALAQTDAARERPREGDLLVAVGATPSEPLKPDDLPLDGKQTFAWPMDPTTSTVPNGSRLNKMLLLLSTLRASIPRPRGALSTVSSPTRPYVRIRGCDVTNWHPDKLLLECPCHYSMYDPKEGAKVVSGPSPRRLPSLPLKNRRRAACRRQALHRSGRL